MQFNIATLIQLLILSIMPVLTGMGAYIVKSVLNRIETLEKEMSETVTTNEVRQILDDKLDPIKSDMNEIKDSMSKLFDLYVNEIKGK